ncbi:MAG: SMC family ATPase [Deltaproteobacteria bacterium]|nr:SMC family ATPase [Deltaproteobacteria bacterium]
MKPIRLEIDGFTCYREKQVIDFSGLSLFAITGPTGAGKSTLLDAVTFALYGEVPRVGREYRSLVSKDRDRASVLFDFSVGAKKFRVARAVRAATATAKLESISADNQVTALAAGAREVSEHIGGTILGLDFQAFTRSVLLPQGKFAEFLASKPSDQRKLMQELLKVDVYQRMYRLASARASELGNRAAELTSDLSGLGSPTRAELDRLESMATEASTSAATLRGRLDPIRAELLSLSAKVDLTVALERAERDLADLVEGEAQHQAQRERSRRARAANALLLRAQAVDSARRDLADRTKARDDAAARLESIERELVTRTEARRVRESEAEKIRGLEERVTVLDGLRPKLEQLSHLRTAQEVMARRIQETESKVRDAGRSIERLEREERTKGTKLRAIDEELTTLGFVAAQLEALESAREDAARLVDAEAAVARARSAKSRCDAELLEARAAAEAARSDQARAREHAMSLVAEVSKARDALERAKNAHSATHLRATLLVGEPCPVCEREVELIPAPGAPGPLEDAAAALSVLEKHKLDADARTRLGDEALVGREARAEAALHRAKTAEDDLGTATERRNDAERGVREAMSIAGGETAAAMFHQTLERQRLKAQRDRALNEDRAKLLGELAAIAGKLDSQRVSLAELERNLGELREGLETSRATAQRLVEEVGQVDPKEREQLKARILTLRDALADAVNSEGRAAATHSEVSADLVERRKRCETAQRELAEAETQADDAARAAGFSGIAEAVQASLPLRGLEALEASLRTHDEKLMQLRARAAALEAQLGGSRVSPSLVSERAREVELLEAALADAADRSSRARNDAERVRTNLDHAETLRRRISEATERRSTLESLAFDLRSDRLQEFVIAESLRDLVRGASVRLTAMSRRYALEYNSATRFSVIDQDQGNARRSTDTLSGGETFLASLSLAMELSAQIQRRSGAVTLDSLFIDEGFGTLDLESLELVAEAIESLPSNGRVVGIVTHVPGLAERLPARIEVEKRREGSTVSVVES